MKNNQLVYALERHYLAASICHFCGILDLIPKLMGVPDIQMDEFSVSYIAAMYRSLEFPISRSVEKLRPLAMGYYNNLKVKFRG